EREGILLLRPLLQTPKSELIAYLENRKVEWVEDPTNQKQDYARNRLRKALENCFEKEEKHLLSQRLGMVAASMLRAREALEEYTEIALKECVSGTVPCQLSTLNWRKYPPEIR